LFRGSTDFLPSIQAELSYADMIGHGIEAEALGDGATLTGADAAARIVGAVEAGPPRSFLVLAPRYGLNWEQEDLLFVRLLAPRLQRTSSRLILVYAEPAAAPAEVEVEWLNEVQPSSPPVAGGLIGLTPGAVNTQVAVAVRSHERTGDARPAMLALANGHMLIAPECRRPPDAVAKLEYDRLAAGARGCDWLRAYAEYYGNNTFVEPQFLLRQAWQRFSEGGTSVALRLLDRAADCSVTPLERTAVACQAQGIRIALRRFADAARQPDPPLAVPVAVRTFLLRAKAYALVMSGDPQSAMTYFHAEWKKLENEPVSRESLYLLNISALALLKLGDARAALEIERDIEARAVALATPDWRLNYIIRINIARLCHRLDELESARRFYDLAFAATLGGRSESEAVYTNVCTARIDSRRGCHLNAFLAWLRASLHWVVALTPEALAPRVANTLVRSVPNTPEGLVESISRELLSSLEQAARESGRPSLAGVTATESDTHTPVFLRPDCLDAGTRPEWALGGNGWGVLGSSCRLRETVMRIDTDSRRQLRPLIYRLLCEMSKSSQIREAGTLIVDDRLGQEMPVIASELLESAVRLQVPRLYFNNVSVALDERLRSTLERQARVHLGNAVARVELSESFATVVYKRGLAPVTIPKEAGFLLTALSDNSFTAVSEDLLPLLRALEELRMVYLSFPEESCTAAGIW
jgi:hypothetical protein